MRGSSTETAGGTSILAVQMGDDEVDALKERFRDVTPVRWGRSEVGMPRDREEMYPLMKFFADRLRMAGG